jgi:hypothetical protein
MRVPFDHAIDREWVYGLNAVSVSPFPIDQTRTGFRTSIQRGPAKKLSKFWRVCFTFPYQALNEVSRWLFRISRALALCFSRTIYSSKHLKSTESSSPEDVAGDTPV